MRARDPLSLVVGLGALWVATGCEDLSRFSTRPNEAYCGAITLGSAFRAGLSPRVQMRLELDAAALDGPDPPGHLWTYEAATDDRPDRRLLDGAALRPIAPLTHDVLSHLEMGDGRERNAIYAVSPSDSSADPLLAVLSLRSDGSVEVRLLRPGVEGASPPDGRRSVFGLFSLVRRRDRCGF